MHMHGKQNALLGSLPLVASMIGKKHNVKVVIGKTNNACTDGATIHLPALDPDDPVTEVLARGYIDHEVGHVRHTEAKLKAQASSEFAAELYNIVEDVRIERLMSGEYPGCRINLDRLWGCDTLSEHAKQQGAVSLAETAQTGWSPRAQVEAHIVQRGRARVIGQTKPLATCDGTEAVLRQAMGDTVTDGLNDLLDEIGGLSESREALDLAERIVRFLNEQAPDSRDESDNESDADSKQDDDVNEGDQVSSDEADAEEPEGDSKGGDTSSDEEKAETEGEETDSDAASDTADKQERNLRKALNEATATITPSDAVAEALADVAAKAQRNGTAVAPGDAEEMTTVTAGGTGGAEEALHGRSIRAGHVLSKTAVMRTRMAGLLQAMSMVRRLPAKRGRAIVSRKLATVPLGDRRMFAKKTQAVQTDTLVTVLIDRSSSMTKGNRIQLAMEAAYGVCAGVAEIRGVRLACHAFPAPGKALIPMIGLGEDVRRNARRFKMSANGGTPMADALWQVAIQTAPEPEPRKLIIVVTDGEPWNAPAVHGVTRRLTASGYELLGIGIGLDTSKYFSPSRTIHRLDDLSAAMFEMLTEALVSNQKKAA
jgi:cobalamin biosynthesis protein CobT